VYARANGYLRARYVDIGDHVRKGQVLAIIDAPDLDAQVAQAREQLRQAEMQVAQQQAQLDLARVTWERYRVLVAKGVFSRQDGDQQDVNYRAQQANVSAASRNVDAYKANLQRVIALADYEKVRAPFDGVVTARNVDVGALIQTSGAAGTPAMASNAAGSIMSGGQTQAGMSNTAGATGSGPTAATPQNSGSQGGPLFSIAQMQTLRVLVSAPEGYVGSVQRGTPAELHFQEFPQQTFFGKVTRNAGSLDQNTRTLLTEVDIDNHDGKLLPGMYAVVTFSQKDVAAHESGGGALLIPGDAIVIRQDQPEVALVRDGVVHLQPVVIGRDYGASTEITDGLRPGDTLVIDVTDDVVEGAHVKAQPSKSAAQTVNPQAGPQQNTAPPGGSTQYGNPAITNANMMGQQGKQGKKGKQGKGGTKGAEGSGTSKP
jgi:multidrug efflux pump subunit AcrA (membrane-fusion protein)